MKWRWALITLKRIESRIDIDHRGTGDRKKCGSEPRRIESDADASRVKATDPTGFDLIVRGGGPSNLFYLDGSKFRSLTTLPRKVHQAVLWGW